MIPERLQRFHREREIFEEALSVDESGLSKFLESACRGDGDLRAAVEHLLALHADDHLLGEAAIDRHEDALGVGPGSELGNYRVVEELGRGGMGIVFRAEQVEPLRRKVALKVIKAGMDTEEVIARFEAERQALAVLDHPNIARIFDAGSTDSGRPYFVMELVKGIAITQFCDEQGLSTRERLRLFVDVCAAIQHAHQRGIIHRDLKPTNVLVTVSDDEPTPKIIDFGIAKAIDASFADRALMTQFQQLMGTPAYMSPEQAGATPVEVDTRTDIYSLGVLLYELLTGKTPLAKETLNKVAREAVLEVIREADPPKPSTRVGKLSQDERSSIARLRGESPERFLRTIRHELDWVVMKALDKELGRRYATASELAQDVARYLCGDPVSAAPPGALYRAGKFVRRHRLAVGAAIAVVMALLTGLGTSLVFFGRERSQRRIAETNERLALQRGYGLDLKLAQTAFSTADVDLMKKTLESYFPAPDQPDMRGWMWRYLYGQLRQEETRMQTLDTPHAPAISPDGRRLAVSGWRDGSKMIEVIDTTTWRVEHRLDHAGDNWIPGMSFSSDGEILIVEPSESAPLLRYDLTLGTSSVLGDIEGWPMRITPDARFLVHGPHRLYELVGTGARPRLLKESDPYPVPDYLGRENEVRISPDGKLVSLSCADRTVRLFSVPDLRERAVIRVPGEVTALAWFPDSRSIATGYRHPFVIDVWDVDSEKQIHVKAYTARQRSPSTHLEFSPEGDLLAMTESSGLLHVWETQSGAVRRVYSGVGEYGCLAFFPDGDSIATVNGNEIKRWDVSAPVKSELRKQSEEISLWNLQYSPDGKMLAASSDDGTIRIFDAATKALVKTLQPESEREGRRASTPYAPLRFSRDGRILVAINNDHTVGVYDLGSGEHLKNLRRPWVIEDVDVSPNGRLVCTVGRHGDVIFWDAESGNEAFRVRKGPWMSSVAFSPDPSSKLVAFGYRNDSGTFFLMRTDTKTQISRQVPGGSCTSLSFSPDGRVLACGQTGKVKLFSVPDLDPLGTIEGTRGIVPEVSFSADGSTLAIPCRGGFVQLWNRKVKAEVGRLPMPSTSWVISAAFAPHGSELAISTLDDGVMIFEAPTMEEIDSAHR